VVYFDESAITALGAEYPQVLPGPGRASNILGAAAAKERITTGIFSAEDGGGPPSFTIIRCTSKKTDMRKLKVISELYKLSGFTAEDGWKLREWCHDVLIKGKDGVQNCGRQSQASSYVWLSFVSSFVPSLNPSNHFARRNNAVPEGHSRYSGDTQYPKVTRGVF
jgi:hypothetical protein